MRNKADIRAMMRSKRLAMTPQAQRQNAQKICDLVAQSKVFLNSRHIGFYAASKGEADPKPLLKLAWQKGKACYLPILNPLAENSLLFAPCNRATQFRPNRYGIHEPVADEQTLRAGHELELILVPLVAFDSSGQRLGMGKGYYDRTFAFLKERLNSQSTLLLGLAHSFQEVELLSPNSWDVPLNGIATENELRWF